MKGMRKLCSQIFLEKAYNTANATVFFFLISCWTKVPKSGNEGLVTFVLGLQLTVIANME